MKTQNENSIATLNSLIETCRDGAQGYKVAAEDSKDADLKAMLLSYSQEREAFCRELAACVRTLGGDPDKSGSVTGTVHRGWINLKAALSSDEPHAVLVECERGEDSALAAYREASSSLTDPAASAIVSRQMNAVQAAHDTVRNLRDGVVSHR